MANEISDPIPLCDHPNCGLKSSAHCFTIARRTVTTVTHMCANHLPEAVADFYAAITLTDVKPAGAEEVQCEIELVVVDHVRQVSWIYLREASGGRVLALGSGWFEGSALIACLQGRTSRPLTHEAMANVIRSLGGRLNDVLLDWVSPKGDVYHAKLRISQFGRLILVDVRPTDAFPLAVLADVPIIASKEILAR